MKYALNIFMQRDCQKRLGAFMGNTPLGAGGKQSKRVSPMHLRTKQLL